VLFVACLRQPEANEAGFPNHTDTKQVVSHTRKPPTWLKTTFCSNASIIACLDNQEFQQHWIWFILDREKGRNIVASSVPW